MNLLRIQRFWNIRVYNTLRLNLLIISSLIVNDLIEKPDRQIADEHGSIGSSGDADHEYIYYYSI